MGLPFGGYNVVFQLDQETVTGMVTVAFRPTTAGLLWLVVYVTAMAGIVAGLFLARQRTIAALDSPDARAAWDEFRQSEEVRRNDGGPVERRPPTSEEPPALVLMRDSFPAIVATALATGTFLFGFLVFVLRGLWRERSPR